MIDKTRKNLTTGLTRIKWIATFLAERTRAETNLAKLMYESKKLEGRIDELYRDIGQRVLELKEKGDSEEKDVFKDFIVQQAISEIKSLRDSVKDYKKKARNLNKLPE